MTSLVFKPGVTEMNIRVNIIDDEGRVRMEGKEKFQVLLRTPRNGRLSSVSHATVIIDDTESDSKNTYMFSIYALIISSGESTESTLLKLNCFFQRKKPINFKIVDLTLSYAAIFNAYFNNFFCFQNNSR